MKDRSTLLTRPGLLLAAPLLLTLAAYVRVFDYAFQFDDDHVVVTNAAVKDLGHFLRNGFLDGFWRGGRPVADLTFAMNYAVGGLEPWNFHITNVAIHLVAVTIAWAFVRRLARFAGVRRAEWLALGAAGVFALHPLQTQAVSYISQRSEVLASTLYVGAMLLILEAERRGLSKRALGSVAGAWLVFVLALGTKAIAVTLPVAWLLVVALVPSPETRAVLARWRRRLLVAAPFLGIGGFHAWRTVTATTGGAIDAGFAVPGLTPWTYLLTQLRVVATYVRLLFWPAGQNVDWDFPQSNGLAEPSVILSAAFLLALAGGALWLAVVTGRRLAGDAGAAARAAGFGVLWFFLLLAPTSSVIPIADVLMEHRVYLASLGMSFTVAVGVEWLTALIPGAPTKAFAALLAVLWTSLAVATHARNAVWESSKTLWADATRKSPRKPRPLTNLAYAVANEGRLDEALRLDEAALKLVPPSNKVRAISILENIGGLHLAAGRPYEARAVLRQALQLGGTSSNLYATLSSTHLSLMEIDEAEAAARRAIMVGPSNAEAWSIASLVAYRGGRKAEALERAQRAVASDPDLAEAHFALGQALHGLGNDREACVAWERLGPTDNQNLSFLRSQAGCGATQLDPQVERRRLMLR